MKGCFAFGLVPVLLALTACGTGLARVDTGPPLSDADLAMGWSRGANRSSGDFSEQIVLKAELDDGGSVYVKFVVSNIANADGRGQFTFDVKLPDGRRLDYRERAQRGDWSFEPQRFHVEIGDVVLDVGVGRASVVIDADGLAANFEIRSEINPLRPSGGRIEQGGLFYVTTIPIPRGQATLAMTVRDAGLWKAATPVEAPEKAPETEPAADTADTGEVGEAVDGGTGQTGEGDAEASADTAEGEESFEFEGLAYVEHRWGNVPPYELAHRWYNLLVIGADETVVMSAFERPKPTVDGPSEGSSPDTMGVVHGWLFAARDDGLTVWAPELDVRPYGWRSDDVTSYRTPAVIYVSDPQKRSLRGVLELGSLSQRKDDLAGLKKLERLVVRRFMQPWTFTYNMARFLFRTQEPGEPAIDARGRGRFMFQQIRQ